MRKYYVLISLFLIPMAALAQSKFGDASKDELSMTSYENDTTATAVVLKKDGRIRFLINREGSFQYEYTLEKKVKILKDQGLDYADGEITYFISSRNSKEEVKNLSGTTYNLDNGKVTKTKLSKNNIFDEDADGKWNVKKFTMPAAKVGSIVEYKYTIVSDFIYELKDFYFQESIPVKEVKLEVVIPEYLIYHLNNKGYIRMDVAKTEPTNENYYVTLDGGSRASQSGNITCSATRHIFEASNVPSAKNEAFLWTVDDYISKVAFELRSTNFPGSFVRPASSTWADIDKRLMEANFFGGNLKRSGWFKDDVAEGEATIEKATTILEVIKSKVQWDKKNSLMSSKLKKALDDGVGNSAEMNFLLVNALKAGGFDPYPVVLSTRSNGGIPITHPSITALNYVIVGLQIGEDTYYADASSKFGTWNLLPEKCMVNQARAIKNGRGQWVDLSKISSGAVLRHTVMSFEDGKSILKVKETRSGNSAHDARTIYSNYESEEKFVQNIEENNSCTVTDFSLIDYENKNKPLITELTEIKNLQLEDYLYLTPPLVKLYKENPFKTETRMFPINFDHLLNHIQVIEINIPEGYKVVEIPKAERVVLQDNAVLFTYQAIENENKLTLSVRFQIKTLLLLPTDYEYLKDFFAKMINKNNEQIVLQKI